MKKKLKCKMFLREIALRSQQTDLVLQKPDKFRAGTLQLPRKVG